MHPILITALAEDRRRRCPCGAVAQQRYGLCHECQVTAARQDTAALTRHRAIPSSTRAKATHVRFFAPVASLIRLSSRKAES
jgi:hypothetical protein